MKQKTPTKLTKKIPVLFLLSFFVIVSAGLVVFLNSRNAGTITNQGDKENQPHLIVQQGKIEITLVDISTKQPLANKTVTIRQSILCKDGANCTPPVLFLGKTDNLGKVNVDAKVFNYTFNMEVEGYFQNGPFSKEKGTNVYSYNKYSDGSTYTTYKFDYTKDKVIILIDSKKY